MRQWKFFTSFKTIRKLVLQGYSQLMDLDVGAPEREFRYCWLLAVVLVLFSCCCPVLLVLLFSCCASAVFWLCLCCFPVASRLCSCGFPVALLSFSYCCSVIFLLCSCRVSYCSLRFLVLFLFVSVLLFVLSCCVS